MHTNPSSGVPSSDTLNNLFLSFPPPPIMTSKIPDTFGLYHLGVSDTVAYLIQSIKLIQYYPTLLHAVTSQLLLRIGTGLQDSD
ncbi:hypothetical protein AVEN_135485-1 [Araneus ventricosus]|uniref:Uncharacterized protein n=1 Tax=Araneus ventricosus TaxID=182803 RepID=A0A4Y2BFR7_ARAVE|nr:hypothetical protein AVEN_135485-1 [Araneus ventricosus]